MVPRGEVWRTGAHAATVLTTDRNLELAGEVLLAGSYSLWSIPEPEGWTLVVHGETGAPATTPPGCPWR